MGTEDIARQLLGRTDSDMDRAAWEERVQAMYDIANDLVYPRDQSGNVYSLHTTGLTPIIAYHLSMCGYVKDPARQQHKARKLPPTAGVVDDAVEWVPMDAPDIEAAPEDLPLSEIDKLHPVAKAAALRKLGFEPPEVPNDTGWHVKTSINCEGFDD